MTLVKSYMQHNKYRQAITKAYRMDETTAVEQCCREANLSQISLQNISNIARQLVTEIRKQRLGKSSLDALLSQYDLSNEEGIALMCLAEALLRVPDKQTADLLIKDKILSAHWYQHAGKSESMFVNAATWGLMLTGKMYKWNELQSQNMLGSLKKLAVRGGEPFIRKAVNYAMKVLGKQFVMGVNIKDALKRAKALEAIGYRYSYDMLGEAARTNADAERYLQEYKNAIIKIGKNAKNVGPIYAAGISVKLSALHPRYEMAQSQRVMSELLPRLRELVLVAKQYNIGLTVDAEEANRLDLSLDLLEAIFADPEFSGWEGFGLALQSYQKRALYVIDWLIDLSKKYHKRWMLRLIKGAYWDSEIKDSQEQGLIGYPVFTRKASTDVSFLACAKRIIAAKHAFYPQFATHNAYSVAAIMEMMGDNRDFEFQCLHGMGQALYDQIVHKDLYNIPCRIYAPVGCHEDLLPYLVRRLLENGANSSFVNRIVDEKQPIEQLIQDPVAAVIAEPYKPHAKIVLPQDIYGEQRLNSMGLDLSDPEVLCKLEQELELAVNQKWHAGPIINGKVVSGTERKVYDPSDHRRVVGHVVDAEQQHVQQAMQHATAGFADWQQTAVAERAICLERMADLLEEHRSVLMAMLIREAGKTIADALSEVREAVDFCRYYAMQAKQQFSEPIILPGPTGELNQLQMHGRGVIVCISPWNFPLAIFTGQIVAALVAGNSVLAKPAEQTVLVAAYTVQLLHQAGIPVNVCQLLPGKGGTVGASLVQDLHVAGVMFTGSTATARFINKSLAERQGAIVPLIAETGGQNAMLVDSSALPEQVVVDVINSAFGSAGQRCSALRVLFVQDDVAERTLTMLQGAMAELQLGDPYFLNTDIGPVIDAASQTMLENHIQRMQQQQSVLYQVPLANACQYGTFVSPTVVAINDLSALEREIFGPVLHVIRYNAGDLDQVIASINQTGYGLTLGIHSRINEVVEYIRKRSQVGNVYVNRSMTGAVVGVQPFGGEGLSGTGPKAGGPHYLQRLCHERCVSVDTTAAGGNASLMSLA